MSTPKQTLSGLLKISRPVATALAAGQPVVALESTIITHGMPWPQNLETAHAVEQTVMDAGAVPATIAVLDGAIRIGLSAEELDRLAHLKQVRKLSRADLAHALVLGEAGSTTVAATMICAQLAGIQVFATGGLGGVHRGATESMDISADLGEFQKSEIVVVCAGAKAILDIPKTLEVLETLGIPVLSYGTDRFPAFWSRDSGLASPLRLDHPQQIADFMRIRKQLGQSGGVIVANPVPEAAEIDKQILEPLISRALKEARAAGIGGKAVTPFLLQRIFELTEGRSLETNIALVLNNAVLAARIAAEL
uniref:pseudouridine-5'-phosphate glycosidase n=1 Tax=Pararhizobium sp. IMCC3301 TaxID=3067904 RepID=UPI0027412E83|nr:pseudouridine-5'-phosphate glycosidase [Pararhizobium sp. IMCC3301]